MSDVNDWTEIYDGGSVEAERAIFLSLAERMLAVQEINRQKTGALCSARTLHAKLVAGITDASLTIDTELPPDFRISYFQPGTVLPGIVRFSNASGVPQNDSTPDMRWAAARQLARRGHARSSDDQLSRIACLECASVRRIRGACSGRPQNAATASRQVVRTGRSPAHGGEHSSGDAVVPELGARRFLEPGRYPLGERPVRFALRPVNDASTRPATLPNLPDALRVELAQRLRVAPVQFRLMLQRFVDEKTTPIEDGAIEWLEEISPAIGVATSVFPRQDLLGEVGLKQAAQVDRLAFNPWNAPPEFRPLKNLNRARGVVYRMSAGAWQRQQKISRSTTVQ
jgi:hypothetical protein